MPDGRAPQTDIFLHIPKTAGSTLNRIIERNYPREKIYSVGTDGMNAVNRFRALPRTKMRQIRLLRGHIPFGIHRDLPQPAVYFTILREPVERVISSYYFIRNDPGNPAYEEVVGAGLDLVAWLRAGFVMADNDQTRFLSGAYLNVPFGELSSDHLIIAKRNLEQHMAVVGLTGRFDETLLLLRSTFGWQRIYHMPHNVTRRRPRRKELSPAVIDAIREANQFDLDLYNFGRSLFEARIAAAGPTFQAELARFRRRNARLQPFLRTYWAARRLSIRALLKRFLSMPAS